MNEEELKKLFENKQLFNNDDLWSLMVTLLCFLGDNKKENPTIKIYIGSEK